MVAKILGSGARTLFVIAAVSVPASTSFAASFNSAVETVLMNQTDGPVAKLDAGKKRQLIACVNKVLADMPSAARRYVEEADGYEETEHRFGEVVMANKAEWKQKITKECGDLAV